MNKFQAIIFDCDGVLVNSEKIANSIFCDMLNEQGACVEAEAMYRSFVGSTMKQRLAIAHERTGLELSNNFIERFRRRAIQTIADTVQLNPNVQYAIDNIDLPKYIATNGDPTKISKILDAVNLSDTFADKVITASEVSSPKPAPDIYIEAARKLGILPNKCCAVEDSPAGIQSAVSAGMYVLGYAADMPAEELTDAGAHIVFDDMFHLPSLLNHTQH